MNKRIIILIVVILLLISGGFSLWWWQTRPTPPEEWKLVKTSRFEDFVVTETPEGKLVENKKAGLSFVVPGDWEVRKDLVASSPDMTIFSDDAEYNKERSTYYLDVLDKGCRVNVSVRAIKVEIDILEESLKEEFSKFVIKKNIDEYKKIKIDGKLAIKHIFDSENLEMFYSTVHLPFKENLYMISLGSAYQDKENCSEEFSKILETVSIQ